MSDAPAGVLLIQLGTPRSTEISDVRVYLREFLSDPRVIDISAAARKVLLNAVILPFRPRKSARAYRQIWTEEGSPLTIHTQELATQVEKRLGDGYRVAVGMRYQEPSLAAAVEELTAAGCDRLILFALFPQYASASSGSALEAALTEVAGRWNVPRVATVGAFHDDEGYLRAFVETTRPHLEAFSPDHVLFSYHGLPEQQIHKSDPTAEWCLSSDSCCARMSEANRWCYRAQSFGITRAAAADLGLDDGTYTSAFQSRLAGQKWIEPYTDKELPKLYEAGVRRLAVLTPSFTADCLETLEEIGIRARRQWEELGGDALLLVPCLNAEPIWAEAVSDMVRAAS